MNRSLSDRLCAVQPLDQTIMQQARDRWNSIAKPLGGLGLLEDAVVQIAGITRDAQVSLKKRACVVFCADNGVVSEGVTQTGSEVTAVVAENFTRGETCACMMARVADCDLLPVDIGVSQDVQGDLLRHKIAYGTGNIAVGPAMTREQALDALCFGIDLVGDLKQKGYRILATGEMGIGNTTTASAVASVLLGKPPASLTGRGAGLSSDGLQRKICAIERAIAVNQPDPADPIDVLSKVGGLDIAGLCGLFLGGAVHRLPVVVDGVISAAAALAAVRLCPAAAGYPLASHLPEEPAGRPLLDALGISPSISAGLRLGEGTGAIAMLPLLDMAAAVYCGMRTFEQIQIDGYQPLE